MTRPYGAVSARMLAMVVCVVFLLVWLVQLGWVDHALGAMPWWHVNTISAPAGVTGGQGSVVLEVSNLGDAAANGAASPVTIVDELPAGVRPTRVDGGGGGSFPIGINGTPELIECEILGQLVVCAYQGPLLSYERFEIGIDVEVQSGAGDGVSEVVVTGGGASRKVWRHPLALENGPGRFAGETYELSPEEEGGEPDTQAGSHPFQLTSTFTLNTKTVPVKVLGGGSRLEVQPVALPKDLRFVLPPGLVGNPTPLPKCSLAVFVKQSTTVKCPNDTAVGVSSPIVTNVFGQPVPLAEAVPVYSLEPAVGEPARFGFTTPVGPVVLDTSVSPDGGSYPVVVSVSDIPDDVGFIGAQVTFWGVPGLAEHDTARGSCLDEFEGSDIKHISKLELACPVEGKPQPFLIMPTSCAGALRTVAEGDSWETSGRFEALKEYTLSDQTGETVLQDGCDKLSFDPSIGVRSDSQQASTASALTVDVHVDQEAGLAPSGLADATVKDTTVALPTGVVLNPSGADGLAACTLEQIALDSEQEANCPDASKVGVVEVRTPLLPNPLKGSAYLAAQEANPFESLLALYIVVYDPVSGVRVKLAGEVKPDRATGQLVSTFKDTPQLPFEDFSVEFFGGSRSPLATPSLCGSYSTAASIAPWSGAPPTQLLSPPFVIATGPGGAPCQSPPPFAPSLVAGSLNLQAGGLTPFTTTIGRQDGNQNLRSVELRMPPGLSGILTGVALCPDAQANTGECGPESLIGETTVSVGVGDTPYTVTGGKVYLTGPYDGAPFGLSIVNPAKAGPFDLEKTKTSDPACDCLVVRAKIDVNPTTAAITVTTDTNGAHAIPTILEGIPLQIKHVNVTINRPGFAFNPTSCAPTHITASIASSEGATSALNIPFQVTNCATLAFKPSFTVTTNAHTNRAIGAGLHVKLSYPKTPLGTQTNIRSVKVNLPRQMPSRLTTLQQACPIHAFETNPATCPNGSRVGTATATTPLLPVPLTGPAYFVSHGGQKFPELVIVLSGYGVTVDLHGETFITEKTNITSSTFRTVPDVPVGTFQLTLPQGHNSALAATTNLCKTKLKMPTAFTAQNGATIHKTTKITVTGCHHHKK